MVDNDNSSNYINSALFKHIDLIFEEAKYMNICTTKADGKISIRVEYTIKVFMFGYWRRSYGCKYEFICM